MGTFCWLRGRGSPAKRWWKRAVRIAEAQGARHEVGLIHYEMGKRMKTPDFLKKAEVIFEGLHADLDLQRVPLEVSTQCEKSLRLCMDDLSRVKI
jgi:hypothetical protein